MSTPRTATLVRSLEGFAGDARLYRLSACVKYGYGKVVEADHIVVSAAIVQYSGPETYIFAADAEGKILDWTELPGSFKGSLNHARALREAGFSAVEEVQSSA
jgi:hypothetical protein